MFAVGEKRQVIGMVEACGGTIEACEYTDCYSAPRELLQCLGFTYRRLFDD